MNYYSGLLVNKDMIKEVRMYNLADTFFVGQLGDPLQNAAVTLAAPVLLAFNAVNNLFGVGTSSMMSRSLGRGDHEMVRMSSAFGFYGAVFSGMAFALLCTLLKTPLMHLLGPMPPPGRLPPITCSGPFPAVPCLPF